MRTKILPGIESIKPDKRKEILDEIFSISYFKDLRSSEHVKIITELVWESEASYIKVTSELLVLFEKFIETWKVTDQDFKNFQDQAFAWLRELPREKRDNLIWYLQKTRSEIPSFLLWFLKSGTFEFTEDISQVAFKFFASKSLKDNLEKGFLLSLEKVRATLLAGSQEIKRDSSTRWPTGDVMKDLWESLRRLFIDKLSRSLGDEWINQSFTKKEIEDQFFTFSKAYFTDLKIPVEDETLRYIVHWVLTNLIAQLGKKDIPSSYILDLGLIWSPNEKSLALIDFTVNELYLLKDAPGGEKRLEALLIYGVQAKGYKEFLSTSILEKTLIQNFLLLIRFISKSDFKMVLFENKELFEKLLSGAEFSKEEMSQEAMKLLFKLIQKANITQQAPIKAGGTSFENFILFIKKTGVPPEDVSSVFSWGKATFEVLKGKQKFRSKKELFDTHGNEIMKFSKSLFTILSKYVKYYWKPGVQLLIDEKILRTSQGGKGSKAYLMEGLSQVFTYQNIFDTFWRFIQAWFDKKAAQDQFIIDYFSKPSNINHFQEAIFNLVYDKVREPKIVELQIP